jgi:hypothetical protein
MIKEADEDLDVTVEVTSHREEAVVVSPSRDVPGTPDSGSAAEVPGETTLITRTAMDKLTRMASPPDRARLVSFIEQQIREHGAVVDPGPEFLKYVRLHLPSYRGARPPGQPGRDRPGQPARRRPASRRR